MRNSMDALPDTIVIGPQKGGTTWIHRYLESRGDVCLPYGVKETFYFDRYFDRGLSWYRGHFRTANRTACTTEVAPSYFHCEDAIDRIARTFKHVRLICTLREPVARTYSLFLHRRRYGDCSGSLREEVAKNPILVESSRYATILTKWIDAFGKNALHLLFLEDLSADCERYARDLCQCLQLPFDGVDESISKAVNQATTPPNKSAAKFGKQIADMLRHRGCHRVVEYAKAIGLKSLLFGRPETSKIPPISNSDHLWLAEQFVDEIDQLEVLLDTDLSSWRKCRAA